MRSDEDLLEAYQKADARAFDEFFKRRHRLVFGYLLKELRGRAEAEDALQETFLRIHRSIPSYDPGRSALNWVFAIARNVMIDLKAKRPRLADGTEPEAVDGRVSAEGLLALRQEIDRLLTDLKPEDRDLIVGRFIDGDSLKRTAARTGQSLDNTKQRFSRILRKIRATSR